MTHEPALDEYLSNLETLGYDISDYVQLTHSFILLNQLILSAKSVLTPCPGNDINYVNWINCPNYLAILEKYHLLPLPITDEHSKSIVQNLCMTINTFFIHGNYQHYFEYFTPGIVSNWARLREYFESEIQMLIFLRFTIEFVSIDDYSLSNSGQDNHQILSNIYLEKAEFYKPLGIDKGTFLSCCDCIFYTRIRYRSHPKYEHSIIKNAIRIYRKFKIPYSALLEDYRSILIHRALLDASINPWLSLQRQINHLSVESGLSDLEVAFNNAAYKLLRDDVSPTDVITAAFYPSNRDDSAFENSFLYDEFKKITKEARNILIVNPSPQNIVFWIKHESNFILKRTVFAIADRTVADLYRYQFGDCCRFIAVDELPTETQKYDALLLLARDFDPKKLYSSLSLCTEYANIIAFLPQSELSSSGHMAPFMKNSCLSIDRVIALPTSITHSTPRKKMVLYASKSSRITFQLQFAHCQDMSYGFFTFEKCCYSVPENVLSGNITLTKIRNNYLLQHSDKIVNHPNEPQIYHFSNEITIYYTLHSNRKNRYAAKAYYRAILRSNDKGRKRGDRLTDFVEKGLRAESETEVIQNLEYVVYDERIAPHVVHDICDYYKNHLTSLSLKTIWFCCRDALLFNSSYRENIALELFCSKNKKLSTLLPITAATSDYESAMHELLPAEAQSGLKYWRQLDLIFRVAKKAGFVTSNPVGAILEQESNRASIEEREIRNALGKKIFSTVEEARMRNYLFISNPFLCIHDSQWLGAAICFLTGMSIGEVCSLTWGEFAQIQDWDAYQLIIAGYVNQKNVFIPYEKPSEWLKCRKVPVHPLLAEVLLARKKHVVETNQLTESQLARLPIVQKNEINPKNFCPRSKLKDKCQLLIGEAGILPHLISIPDPDGFKVSDLHRYHGDIMYTNYKHKVTELCGFTLGERSYTLGIQAPDTFSVHYCDYGHDLIQYGMVQKLNRWTTISTTTKPVYSSSTFLSKSNDTATSAPGLVASVDVYIEASTNTDDGYIDINIENEFGINGAITVFSEE